MSKTLSKTIFVCSVCVCHWVRANMSKKSEGLLSLPWFIPRNPEHSVFGASVWKTNPYEVDINLRIDSFVSIDDQGRQICTFWSIAHVAWTLSGSSRSWKCITAVFGTARPFLPVPFLLRKSLGAARPLHHPKKKRKTVLKSRNKTGLWKYTMQWVWP